MAQPLTVYSSLCRQTAVAGRISLFLVVSNSGLHLALLS